MRRRLHVRARCGSLLALALVGGLVACSDPGGQGARAHAAAGRGPSPVVLVVIDTLRADRLGAYGHDRPTSPHLDAVAAEGIVFERAYAQSTWTKPTTASILTGLYPSVHGVLQVVSKLEAGHETLAERLGAEGYATGAFVANHFVSNRDFGFAQGFDVFEGKEWDMPEGEVYPPAEMVVDRALDWLDTLPSGDDADPFLLYVHVVDPHAPYDPPAAWLERFARPYDGALDGWLGPGGSVEDKQALTEADYGHLLDRYDAEIAYCDAQLGRLFDALRARGSWEPALVVLLSDHGEEFGEHGGLQHGPQMYQEVVHVPLVVKPPAGRGYPAGIRHNGVAAQVDVVPTVLDVVGLRGGSDDAAALPGTSLLERAMLGAEAVPAVAFGEVLQQRTSRAMVIEDRLKYVRQVTPEPLELSFDLARDPGERDPEALDASLLTRMRTQLDGYVATSSRRAGFALVVANDGDVPRELEVRVAAEAGPVEGLSGIDLELKGPEARGLDRPLDRTIETWGERRLHATRVVLCTVPGDEDGFRFAPGADDELVFVDVRVDGQPLDLADFRLGRAGLPAPAHPVELDRRREELLAVNPAQDAAPSSSGLRVHLWREPGLRVEEAAFDPEEVEQLRRLGYFGGD